VVCAVRLTPTILIYFVFSLRRPLLVTFSKNNGLNKLFVCSRRRYSAVHSVAEVVDKSGVSATLNLGSVHGCLRRVNLRSASPTLQLHIIASTQSHLHHKLTHATTSSVENDLDGACLPLSTQKRAIIVRTSRYFEATQRGHGNAQI